MPPNLYVCPNFWKEVDFLFKKTKNKLLVSELESKNGDFINSVDRIESTPILKTISTYIIQTSGTPNDRATKLDRQPFLNQGWVVYKLRYAFNREGASNGLRVIFCKSEAISSFLFVYINLKRYCDDERELEAEIIERISEYVTPIVV